MLRIRPAQLNDSGRAQKSDDQHNDHNNDRDRDDDDGQDPTVIVAKKQKENKLYAFYFEYL